MNLNVIFTIGLIRAVYIVLILFLLMYEVRSSSISKLHEFYMLNYF